MGLFIKLFARNMISARKKICAASASETWPLVPYLLALNGLSLMYPSSASTLSKSSWQLNKEAWKILTSGYLLQGCRPLIHFILPWQSQQQPHTWDQTSKQICTKQNLCPFLALCSWCSPHHTQMGVIIDVDPSVIKIHQTKRIYWKHDNDNAIEQI